MDPFYFVRILLYADNAVLCPRDAPPAVRGRPTQTADKVYDLKNPRGWGWGVYPYFFICTATDLHSFEEYILL